MTWKLNPLGEVAKIGAGNSAPQGGRFFSSDGIPFFRTSDVGRIRFGRIVESADRLNEEGSRGLRLLPKGTILFPKSGASTFLNHRVMLDVDGFVSSHLATIVADESRIRANYLLYFLATIEAQDLVQDHAYPSLNLPVIAGIQVPTPPLEEQHRIVALLDEAFAGIATAKINAEKSLRSTREVFDTHLQCAFSGRGDAWSKKTLGEIADFRNGINFTKASKGRQVRVLGVKDFQNHFHAPDAGLDRVTIDGDLDKSDFLQSGDIVFVRSNGNPELIGRSLVIEAMSEETAHSGFTIRGRLHSKEVLPHYLGHFLKSGAVRRQMVAGGTGTNIKSLNQGTLSRLVVPYPPLAEQLKIVDRLEEVQAEIRHLQFLYTRKLAALDELKQSLLQRAFSGQL